MDNNADTHNEQERFSLAVGGPFYKLLRWVGLVDKPLLLYKRRVIFFALLTWLPLLILAVIGGVAFAGVKVPFIHDIDVHVRFLIVLSILIYAEVLAHDRFDLIVNQFLKCNIIGIEQREKFNSIITSTMRYRDSTLVEIALIILVYTVGHWISTQYLPLGVSSWFATIKNNVVKLTPAGYWYTYLSLPIFQFILLRWYFRILIWYRFLGKVSSLPLQLNSLHPDKAGGLGFLTTSIYALEPFLLAHSVLLSGMIFNRMWNTGVSIMNFQIEIISVLVFILIIPLVPLTFFMVQMTTEKRLGTLNYDVLANRYVNGFRQKWITPSTEKNTALLGTSDIQSLADLYNSFEVSNKMRILPFSSNSVMALVILTVLPLVPLLFTIIPLEKIMTQIMGLIF